jgi:hypothetical protein
VESEEIDMPEGYAPSVFVSSTCYDLSQVRADLERAIERLGLQPIVSESRSFPINPDRTVIDNCLKAVKERADIFVLVIGGRYGPAAESGRSVTNLEYLEAKTKRIPIYVFVQNKILQILPVWKKNPGSDFSDVVDTAKLFEFVDEVRNAKEHWVFGFDEALHIETTLKTQFGYLFMDALAARGKFRDLNLHSRVADLSARSLRLLVEKPRGWEPFLFASMLEDELAKNADLKWDVKYAIKTGSTRRFTSSNFEQDVLSTSDWIQQKLANVMSLVESASSLMNAALQNAFGPVGTTSDIDHLAYVAQRLALTHERLLKWAADFNDVEARPQYERLLSLISASANDAIAKLETIPDRLRSEVSKAYDAKDRGEEYVANVMIVLDTPFTPEMATEFEKIEAWIAARV